MGCDVSGLQPSCVCPAPSLGLRPRLVCRRAFGACFKRLSREAHLNEEYCEENHQPCKECDPEFLSLTPIGESIPKLFLSDLPTPAHCEKLDYACQHERAYSQGTYNQPELSRVWHCCS